MSDSIWTASLASFRDRVAGLEPVPAGVSAAAVSATLGFGLLTKVLEIASKRKDFVGDCLLVEDLLAEARHKSELLEHLADEDIVVFHQYLDCLRQKVPSDAIVRRAIEIPLSVARFRSRRPVVRKGHWFGSRLRGARPGHCRRAALGRCPLNVAYGGIQRRATSGSRSLPAGGCGRDAPTGGIQITACGKPRFRHRLLLVV
jgi:hypothetical protein